MSKKTSRKHILSNLIKEIELKKFAEEVLQETQIGDLAEGQDVANKIFDKFLTELDIESLS